MPLIDWNLIYSEPNLDEDFLKKVKAASEVNDVPYSVLLNYWRERFSVTLQTFNARLITQAYLVIFDNGGGNLERDFSSARAFEMLYYLVVVHNEN